MNWTNLLNLVGSALAAGFVVAYGTYQAAPATSYKALISTGLSAAIAAFLQHLRAKPELLTPPV